MFTKKEIDYIKSQPLARIGTVSNDGQPDVAPVAFDFDGDHFYIGGIKNKGTRKYKNVINGNTKVALVIDDLKSVNPWSPRGIRIFGTADLVERTEGYVGSGTYLRIKPTISWSWAIEGSKKAEGKFVPHRTVHE